MPPFLQHLPRIARNAALRMKKIIAIPTTRPRIAKPAVTHSGLYGIRVLMIIP